MCPLVETFESSIIVNEAFGPDDIPIIATFLANSQPKYPNPNYTTLIIYILR